MPDLSRSSPWILGTREKDLIWIFTPGILCLILSFMTANVNMAGWFAAYYFVSSSVIGSGHIYTTFWRTYADPKELRRSLIYIWAPLLCFSVFFSWRYFSLNWLIYIPAYTGIWHFFRQSYGIQKWYQRKHQCFRKGSDFFVKILSLAPFVLLHFRAPEQFNIILFPNDLLYHKNSFLLYWGTLLYVALLVFWLIYEFRLLKHREWGRLGYVALTVALNGVCWGLGNTEAQILLPLVVCHGMAYFGIMSYSLEKSERKFSYRKGLVTILGTALIFGYYEKAVEWQANAVPLFWESVWAGIYVTPIMLHYIYDTVIWTTKNPSALVIYGLSSGQRVAAHE